MRPIVKICGLMCVEDVRMCIRHGADIVGFVVDYPHPVPWNLNVEAVKELLAVVEEPAKTCIVTSGTPDKVLRIVMETKPGYIQLHGNETLADTAHLVSELKNHGTKIIKTVFPNTPDLEKTAAAFCAAGVDSILFDPRTPGNAVDGGMADLSTFDKLRRAVGCPVILAGGISPENVAEIVLRSRPLMIDLMTGVEISPGMKDEAKVIALFQAIQVRRSH
ncbi:MAG: phosphoribosylanthranilate isomerase [Phycisphaerae bacterium]|nr:phosphoribosylanthranilate isomerase [Phycisphaerae bacterium]